VCILFKEQKYRFLREMANGNMSLRCIKKKCSARIQMDKPMTTIVSNGEHLHEIVNDHDAQCHILRNNCKRKATENITARPSKIMRHELCAAENIARFQMILEIFEFQCTDNDVNYCRQRLNH
jgi:hypothetical protein